jgi:hypothetical protein
VSSATYDVFQRRKQSADAKKLFWARHRWNDRTDFGKRLGHLTKQQLPELSGSVLKAAIAIVQLQDHRFGALIADGKKIAAKAGIGESTWWSIVRPALERVGFMCTVERGGGRMPGGDGHANVYMVPGAGPEPIPPRSPQQTDQVEDEQSRQEAPTLAVAAGRGPP